MGLELKDEYDLLRRSCKKRPTVALSHIPEKRRVRQCGRGAAKPNWFGHGRVSLRERGVGALPPSQAVPLYEVLWSHR